MRYYRAQQLADSLGITRSTVWRWAASGKLPKAIHLSRRVTVWDADQVEAAIKKLAAGEAA